MSYKRKNGDVISRADYEKITDKELRKEFVPAHDTPTRSYDGENFGEYKAPAAPAGKAPLPSEDKDEEEKDKE